MLRPRRLRRPKITSPAGFPARIDALSPFVIESVAHLKREVRGRKRASLDVDEALIALSISATLTPMVQAMIDASATCVYHDNCK